MEKIITYDYLKNLDTKREYKWTLFKIVHSNICRLTYNEDGNKLIYLDIITNGYINEYKYYYKNYETNHGYDLTEENLEGLFALVHYIRNEITNNVDNLLPYGREEAEW